MKVHVLIACFISMMMLNACNNHKQNKTDHMDDGPYITAVADEMQVEWICDGEVNYRAIPRSNDTYHFSECGLQARVRSQQTVSDKVEYLGTFKLAAVSDIHGQYKLMLKLLKNNGIIDAEHNWNFADGHLVITGDLLDRGERHTEILWFLYHLEHQATEAGGKLHLLLGNHEVMVMNGDLRYLNDKYRYTASLIDKPYQDLFKEKTILGDWLRSKNVLLKINDTLFVHAGLHPDLVSADLSLSVINRIFKEHLVETELESPRVGLAEYLHKKSGPVWYRGYFRDVQATMPEVEKLLTHFGVSRIVVGHTSQDRVETRYQGKIIAIDSSIKKGEYGEILFLDGQQLWRGDLSGERQPLN